MTRRASTAGLDTGDWETCSSGGTLAGLADGRHTFDVRAPTRQATWRPSRTAHSWTVDTVAPRTTIGNGPPDPSDNAVAAFEFGVKEAADFECRLHAGEWVACVSPREYADLADGQHTFEVRATDGAGNVGVPGANAATFGFTGSDNDTAPPALTFECRLDRQAPAAFASCSSPRTHTGLSQGAHV